MSQVKAPTQTQAHWPSWSLLSFNLLFGRTIWHAGPAQPGTEPMPPAVEAWSLNCWTAREILAFNILCLNILTGNVLVYLLDLKNRLQRQTWGICWFSHVASGLLGDPEGKERCGGSEDRIAAPAWPLTGHGTWDWLLPCPAPSVPRLWREGIEVVIHEPGHPSGAPWERVGLLAFYTLQSLLISWPADHQGPLAPTFCVWRDSEPLRTAKHPDLRSVPSSEPAML